MTGAPPSRSSTWSARAPRLMLAVLLVLAGTLVGLHVRDYSRVSPLDELQHLDYLNRVVRDGEIVREGDLFGEEALRTEACQGLDSDHPIPPCGLRQYDPEDFQEDGFNSAYINPPTYYGASGAIAWVLSEASGSDSLFTTGRLSGALWLMVAVALIWVAMGDLAIAWPARVPAVLLVMTAPAVLHANATINPDATSLMAGSAVLLAVLRWERGGSWYWPAVAAAVALALKSTNLVGIGLAAMYVVIRYVQRRGESSSASATEEAPATTFGAVARVVGTMALGVGLVTGGWLVVKSQAAHEGEGISPMKERFHVESIGFEAFAVNAPTGFTPLQGPHIPKEIRTAWIGPAARFVDRLFLGGLLVTGLTAAPRSRLRGLALATLLAMAAVGPMFVLVNFVALDGAYVEIPGRYGLSAVPALAVSLAALLMRPRARVLVGAGAAMITLATIRALVG